MKNNSHLFAPWMKATLVLTILLSVFVLFRYYYPWWPIIYGAKGWMLGPATMTDEFAPAWSPSNEYIAFQCGYEYVTDNLDPGVWDNLMWRYENREICIFDIETGKINRLTHGRHSYGGEWSKDGNELVWFDDQKQELVIWGFREREIIHTISKEDCIGKKDPVYDRFIWTDSMQDLFFPCGDPGRSKQLDFPSYNPCDIVWSPNKMYLAISKGGFPDPEAGEQDQLIVMDDYREIFRSKLKQFSFPRWSPDSSFIAWVPSSRVKPTIMLTHVPSGETFHIPCEQYIDGDGIFWSPSGSKIALVEGKQIEIIELEINSYPLSYNIINRVAFHVQGDLDVFYPELSWSPDEQQIAYASNDEDYENNIWILDLNSGYQKRMYER